MAPMASLSPPLERLSEEKGVLAADCEGEASTVLLLRLDSGWDDRRTEEDFCVSPDSSELEIDDSSSVLMRNSLG